MKQFLNAILYLGMAAALSRCGIRAQTPPPRSICTNTLTTRDIQWIIAQAASKAREYTNSLVRSNAVIAVSDREGYMVGVYTLNRQFDIHSAQDNAFLRNAIGKAGTAAFLSSSQEAFSSRTASFIVQQHFPPGIENTPTGPLVGVNFSNLGFSDINRYKNPVGYNGALTNGTNGGMVPLPFTGGLSGASGGLPLYKDGCLVGGLGVAGDGEWEGPVQNDSISVFGATVPLETVITNCPFLYELTVSPELVQAPDLDEQIALAGQLGYGPPPGIEGNHVFVGGIALAYVAETAQPPRIVEPLTNIAFPVPGYTITNPPPVKYPSVTLGGVTGELRIPIIDDPALNDSNTNHRTIGGQARLTAAEVLGILKNGANRARTTRAGIRLPRGVSMQCFISVVANPNSNNVPPPVLGCFCTSPDATRFSWDVSVQKARTALFFSDTNRAFSSRTVGFLAQQFYPPGIAHTEPGIFRGLQEQFSGFVYGLENPLNGAIITKPTGGLCVAIDLGCTGLSNVCAAPIDPNLPNGITIFPGGFPLYRNGQLIGAVGVSGDGIDQDDIVAASATAGFLAPDEIRADRFGYRGARLPYAKFPRNPAL